MMNSEEIKGKIEYNYKIAEKIIKQWYETEHFVEIEDIDAGTTEKLLKLIHKEELFCRQLVQSLPGMQSIEICMTIYGECTYGKYKKYHGNGYLHIYVAEAIRILLYGISFERECQIVLPTLLFELLEHIEIMVGAKEIAQMIEADILCDAQNLKLTQGRFSFSERDDKIVEQYRRNYSGKGLRLRIAEKSMELLYRDLEKRSSLESNFVESIQKLLTEPISGRDIPFFKGTYYEFFPAVNECDDTYKDFLKTLLEKIDFLIKYVMLLMRQYIFLYSGKNYSATDMSRIFGHPFIIPDKIVKDCMVFVPEWRRWRVTESNEIKILNMPIVRNYDGKYITSFLMCGDAINTWVEVTIYKGSDSVEWKKKICQRIEKLFEDEVIDYLRKYKFVAGQVEQNGIWHIDSSNGIKNLEIVLPGEVDVLAINYNKKVVYLIECKRVHDILSAKGNIYQKFKNIKSNLSGKYVQKMKKKRKIIQEYVEKHLLGYQLITVILTDIDFPVYLLGDIINDWEKNICICDFAELKKAVVKNRLPHSCVQHI